MRILYIDIDSLRADHLGCYGYHRNTSPCIDGLARRGTRFDNCYVSDAPCLPSRTALWSGRFGFHTGVVGHGGTAADPFVEGPNRGFRSTLGESNWMSCLRRAGLHTVTVSPFAERHSAWHWYAGFSEIYNTGHMGQETAAEVTPVALDWLERNGERDNWFLHINLWDPHTPYRTPMAYGDPFADEPLPAWLTEEVRVATWNAAGSHSAQELHGYPGHPETEGVADMYPRLPEQLAFMADVRRWIDGYDTGIRYADDHVGHLLDKLEELGVLEETIIFISADHGENQGELNVWGDHQTADDPTCRVPLIVSWPGLPGGRVDRALHYHFDWAATLIEMVGEEVPANWDGVPFTGAFRAGEEAGRAFLVTSQGAWAVQRGVRFNHEGEAYLCLRTYHEGHKLMPPFLLFNLSRDPHELDDLSAAEPELVNRAMKLLEEWHGEMMASATSNVDPLMTVLQEGGPFHTRGWLEPYVEHLRQTNRHHLAEQLLALYPEVNG